MNNTDEISRNQQLDFLLADAVAKLVDDLHGFWRNGEEIALMLISGEYPIALENLAEGWKELKAQKNAALKTLGAVNLLSIDNNERGSNK